MHEDPWEPWSSDLDRACASGDVARIESILEDLWRFPFHAEGAHEHARWDRLFARLLGLLGHERDRLRSLAYHYVNIAMGAEYAPPYRGHGPEDRARLIARRTLELLPALEPAIRRGAFSLLRVVDDLAHIEGRAEMPPQPAVRDWLVRCTDAARHAGPWSGADGRGDSALELAARIAYLDGRAPWERDGESLSSCLDHDDARVRAYAARALGRRYRDFEAEPSPPLRELVTGLTAREIERPGIAGPFFSNWYGDPGGLEEFAARAGVSVEDWFCSLLAARRAPEPETLPCSNGIDFYAHEIFGGRSGYVRRLIDMGHVGIALQAATEVDERIDDLQPLLIELAASADDAVCRQASWHLASHHRVLHPEGERRGFVLRRPLVGGGELFLELVRPATGEGYAYAAVLFPSTGESFDERAAAAALAAVLPEAMRGELLPYGLPGDAPDGFYRRERSLNARYACGALVEWRGDVPAQRWERIRVLWHGAPGAWRPEVPGR